MLRRLPIMGSDEAKQFCQKWDSINHAGKLALCNQYGVVYTSGKEFRLKNDIPRIKIIQPTNGLTELEYRILNIVKSGTVSIEEISQQVDRSHETVIKTIDALRDKHYEVVLDETSCQVSIPHIPSTEFQPSDFKYFKRKYTIGLVSDIHIGSKYQQMTLLHDAYSLFDNRQTDFNVHAGDVFDGVNMYKGHQDELFLIDADKQLRYAIDHYPRSARKVKTYVIGGQHDYCFIKQNGYNIVHHLCEQRKDLVYRGFYNAEFPIKGLLLGIQHPGGGIAYARSYRIQKIIEAIVGHLAGIIRNKPDSLGDLAIVIFFGHWHFAIHLPGYMGIDAVALPCLQSQTRYLQQRGYLPDIGCAVAELWLNENDCLSSVKVEFINMGGQIKENDF